MGYYISLDVSDVVIPASASKACLDAINRLEPRWNGGETHSNLLDAIHAFGFDATTRADGAVEVGCYEWEKWNSALDDFVNSLAPFVQDGGVMEGSGEEGEAWRWRFRGGQIEESYRDSVFLFDEDRNALREEWARIEALAPSTGSFPAIRGLLRAVAVQQQPSEEVPA